MSVSEDISMNFFSRLWADIGTDVLAATKRFGEGGWYVLGAPVKSCENALGQLTEHFAIGVGNGMDAIEISLRCLGISPGEKVLTTPLSAFATTLAIVRAGGIPVFVDVNESGLINLDLVEELLSARPDIRYLVGVHLYGHCMDLPRLKRIADRYRISVIEDAAQSLGAGWQSEETRLSVGSASALWTTSFYPTKNLGCLGDGGAIFTRSEGHAATSRSIRDYGQSSKYCHDVIGMNSRLDGLQACIIEAAMLPRFKGWTERRKQIASRYLRELCCQRLEIPRVPDGSDSVWHLFPVLVKPELRNGFQRYLKENYLIDSAVHYPTTIPEQHGLDGIQFEAATSLEKSVLWSRSTVSLPINPYMNESEVDRVIEACNAWN